MNIEQSINTIINKFNLDKIYQNKIHNLNILEAYWLNLNTINPNYSIKSNILKINGSKSSVIPKNSLIKGSYIYFTQEDFYYNDIQLSKVNVSNGYIYIKFKNIDCKHPIRIYTNRHILHAIFGNKNMIETDDIKMKLSIHDISSLISGNVFGGSFTIYNQVNYDNQDYIDIKIPIQSQVNCNAKDLIINHIDISNESIQSVDIDIDHPGEYLINNGCISKTIGLYYNNQKVPFIDSDVNGWYYIKKQGKLYIYISDYIINKFNKGFYNLVFYSLRDFDNSDLFFQNITDCSITNMHHGQYKYDNREFNYQIPSLYEDNLQNLIKRLQALYQDCFFKLKINPIVVPSTMNNISLPVIKYNCTIFSNLNHPSLFYSISNHYQEKYLINYQISH